MRRITIISAGVVALLVLGLAQPREPWRVVDVENRTAQRIEVQFCQHVSNTWHTPIARTHSLEPGGRLELEYRPGDWLRIGPDVSGEATVVPLEPSTKRVVIRPDGGVGD